MMCLPNSEKSHDMSTRFDRMYKHDRQTQTHTETDGHCMMAKAALVASIAWQKLHSLTGFDLCCLV